MGLIPEDIINQVLDRSDIVETIAAYIPVKRAGRNFKALCPFHNEKTPSFVINPEKQIFHCFGCHTGGNVVSFVMKQESMTFPEAIRLLASRAGVAIPEDRNADPSATSLRQLIRQINTVAAQYYQNILLNSPHPSAEHARGYLQKRGIRLETVKQFGVGFALDEWDGLLKHLRNQQFALSAIEKAGLIVPKKSKDGFYDRFRNRVIFPIFDIQGRCVAFGGRTLGDSDAKYINSPETAVYTKGQHLYAFHLAKDAIRKEDAVVVSEGYLDALVPVQAGVSNIVASLGTSLTVDQIRLIRRFTSNVTLLFDTDQAGEEAMMRSVDLVLEEGLHVRIASLNPGEDPDSFIRKFGAEAFSRKIEQAQTFFDYKLEKLLKRYDGKSPDGKGSIARAILPTINRIPDAVERFAYVRRLSEAIDVPEEALALEMRKVQNPGSIVPQDTNDGFAPLVQTKIRTVERDLLRLMLTEEKTVEAVKKAVTADDFQDERMRRLVIQIFQFVEEGRRVTASELINSFDDSAMAQLITQLVTAEDWFVGDIEKAQRDYINRMVKDRIAGRKKNLQNRLRDAQRKGNEAEVKKILSQINDLIKVL